ncbi:MAG: hypothetical protein NTZ93_02390 [Candidatus Beckwithbacteria bacterium]|nr:hypothetical protein [Candidatus Beckwithbacteria bacterium]
MLTLWMLILPMIVWFVELVLPFPALIEEAAKALVIYRSSSLRQAFGLGLVFGFSEAILFLVNANLLQNMSAIFWRLLLTMPMHGITAAMIVVFGKRYWWLGLMLAILTHYLFNLKIAS